LSAVFGPATLPTCTSLQLSWRHIDTDREARKRREHLNKDMVAVYLLIEVYTVELTRQP